MRAQSFGSGREVLLTWRTPRIVVVTMNRPEKRNACNRHAWQGIASALAAASDGQTRLAILTGAGGHFCAGDDIVDSANARANGTQQAYAAGIESAFQALVNAPFPVIAVISGYCIGGAVSLAMCCDFRLATNDAQFSIPAARLGFSYPYWQCARLMSLVGIQQARKILFEGSPIAARAAHDVGLIDQLCHADPLAAAADFGASMLENAPLSIAASKRTFHALASGNLGAHLNELTELTRRVEHSADLREGVKAFQEKRQPQFTGT